MADLDTQIFQAQARLKDLQAKARRMKRRDDTRRKILSGAAVLLLIEELEAEKRERTLAQLHSKVAREADREFLALTEKRAFSAHESGDGVNGNTRPSKKAG